MEKNHRAPVRDYITVRRFAEDAGDNDFKSVSYTHLDVYKRQILNMTP